MNKICLVLTVCLFPLLSFSQERLKLVNATVNIYTSGKAADDGNDGYIDYQFAFEMEEGLKFDSIKILFNPYVFLEQF